MNCPYCQKSDTRVVEKRDAQNGAVVRRRRECLACRQRFTTYEQPAILDMAIVKKNGSREPFDRNKLLRGIQTACRKRPVSAEQIDALVTTVEQKLISRPTKETPSRVIGEMVMDALKRIDPVAYIRFASVYRAFHDAEDFQQVLRQLEPS